MILGKTVLTLGESAKAVGRYFVAAMAFSSSLAITSAIAAPAAEAVPAAGYTPMKPTPGIGMPVEGGIGLQQQ